MQTGSVISIKGMQSKGDNCKMWQDMVTKLKIYKSSGLFYKNVKNLIQDSNIGIRERGSKGEERGSHGGWNCGSMTISDSKG